MTLNVISWTILHSRVEKLFTSLYVDDFISGSNSVNEAF